MASERIIITNPIYNAVFKYLMDDLESAKIIISTLLNKKILSLKPLSNDLVNSDPPNQTSVTSNTKKTDSDSNMIPLMRLDYSAEILHDNNTKELVTIELQKARFPSDELRFRQYIAENLKRTKDVKANKIDPDTGKPKKKKVPMRYLPIFILNFDIEKEIKDLVLITEHFTTGMFSGKKLTDPSRFLDNLLYNIIVVQLPYINKIDPKTLKSEPHKLAIYHLFQLFNQNHQLENDKYSLFLEDTKQTQHFERLVKRLANIKANDRKIVQKMILEDTMLQDFLDLENERVYHKKIINKQTIALEEKDKTIKEKDKTIEEKDKTIEEKDKKLEEKEKTIEAKDTLIQELMKKLKGK
ncbi:MAG: hypothetical protein QM539_09790 [Alphaproteobacteria bacterium]|nr:hypothetical protein [Alphaproteobacteria bacterium]